MGMALIAMENSVVVALAWLDKREGIGDLAR
jgi:hypothetical protein